MGQQEDGAHDPMRAAQRQMRPGLPMRFYAEVTVAERPGGDALLLDGKPLITPGRAELLLPAAGLAHAVAQEWRAQGERIDPESMPLTRLANSAIDGVRGREAEVAADIARYAASDLLCYRAGYPEELAARQREHWDPVLDWLAEAHGCRLVVATGVMHVAQPEDAVARIARLIGQRSAFPLAALHSLTTLTGSVLLALAHAERRLALEATWAAAHVDEDWQIAQWGKDLEAAERRRRRKSELAAASRMLELLDAANG
jgi:chaperone required for assembly of F1-ATPase